MTTAESMRLVNSSMGSHPSAMMDSVWPVECVLMYSMARVQVRTPPLMPILRGQVFGVPNLFGGVVGGQGPDCQRAEMMPYDVVSSAAPTFALGQKRRRSLRQEFGGDILMNQ